jgi:hypothetical protein
MLGLCATWAGLAGVAACGGGSHGSSAGAAGDGGDDESPDQSLPVGDTGASGNPDVVTVVPEASVHNCVLSTGDGGAADPVLLCSQETALLNLLTNAYTTGTGVAPGFSSQPPYTATTGHAWQDDLSLAASLGAFQCSALAYGDTVYLGMFDGVLADLGKLLPAEVVTTGRYDGELYFQLRNAAQGLSRIGEASVASALDAQADAYARGILAGHVVTLLPATDGGDAGAPAVVIGAPDTQTGAVSYAPAQAVMAAAALLDLAARDAASGDAGNEAAALAGSASQALAYLWARGRDPVTGLFFQSLVTGADPGHDPLGTGMYANDALLSDVQAAVVLGLARAQTAATVLAASGDAGTGAPPYAGWTESLVSALNASGLFDGPDARDASDASDGGVPAPSAFMQGVVPSLGLTLTNKTTASNALLLGGYGRAQALGAAGAWAGELGGLRQALAFTSPAGVPWPEASNFASVVTDALGDVTQVAYLTAVSRSWGWAQAFSPQSGEGSDAGLDPDAMIYGTAAVSAMVEGATQGWYGQDGQHNGAGGTAAPCAY